MIWIRADANKRIGMGHVMRCLSIAGALKKLGEQVCVLTADESAVPLLQERGQEYRVLHSDYAMPEEELGILEELLSENPPCFFLADSYFVTAEYFKRIRKYAPVGYLDDKCFTGFPLDVLINYNIFAEPGLYEGQNPDAMLLLGPKYAPLREEFACGEYQVRERASRVLVTTGGSDAYNLAGRFLEKALALRETEGLEYHVISGMYNVHRNDLRELEREYSNVQVFSNVSNMAQRMRESDIAVTAGGSTMYELSAAGVPMVCFSFVDNQERIVEGFRKRELVCFGGNYLTQGDGMLEAAAGSLALLASDRELRRSYSEKQRRMVDGLGAMRIGEALVQAARRGVREK